MITQQTHHWHMIVISRFTYKTDHDRFTSGPKELLNNHLSFSAFFFFCFNIFHVFFFPKPLSLHLISIFLNLNALPSAISLDLSLLPSVLYGKTFLVFSSAPAKPGAYFQCPKLIANVRKDPSSHSSTAAAASSSLFGISSKDTWNIFVTILNPGVLCFSRCSSLYSTACVFVEISRERKSTAWESP